MNETLNEIRDILKNIESMLEKNKKHPNVLREAQGFNTYLDQFYGKYDYDISEPIPTDIDPMPYVPTQAASHEQVMEAQRKLEAWLKRHPEFDNNSSNKYTNNSNEYQFKID